MPAIVVEASVAVKWYAKEEYSEQAIELLARSFERNIRLVGPELLPFEVASAILWQRRGLLSPEEADRAIADNPRHGIDIVDSASLLPMVVAFTQTHQLSAIYDAVYVVLARELGAEFWTDDQRLLEGLDGRAPWVRWIAEWGRSSQ